ncbi:MAG: hypothetical protein AAF218_01810 [Pseudomonadota bacterium]
MKTLTNLSVIALMTAAPMAVLADAPVSGSPQQSVENDPDEYAVDGQILQGSIGGTNSGSPAQSIEDDPNETALDTLTDDDEGSMGATASGSPAQSIENDPDESADNS